jgi:exonuclease III
MNRDEEIEDFLHGERRVFEERNKEKSPIPKETERRKGKEKAENTETRYKQLKEKWKKGKKEIKITCHNINGLKTRGWKLENLLGWAEEEEIAFLGITETNITEKEGKILVHNLNTRFKGYWTSAASDKKKGSGVGILIDETWEKHVGAVKRPNEYMIEVKLYFKQLVLIIIGVYIPPNDKATSKKIQQKIVKIVTNKKKHTEVIILEDLNHTVNNILDRLHLQTTGYKKLSVFN